MGRIHRILIPTDFSACANHAVEYATDFAIANAAPVVLLHVYRPPMVYMPEGVWVPPSLDIDVYAELDRALRQAADKLRAAGVREVEPLLVDGDARTEILRVAADRACDLIIMGTHGRGPVKHLLLGSVAEKIVRKAPCPVLTVRGP